MSLFSSTYTTLLNNNKAHPCGLGTHSSWVSLSCQYPSGNPTQFNRQKNCCNTRARHSVYIHPAKQPQLNFVSFGNMGDE